ncbi:hypothetical protein CFC21_046030, partial [Triticum aestivum]
ESSVGLEAMELSGPR